ncbi:RNA exonuclease 3 [Tulasnella sp. 424]|nr:RNA exonuclease 3 [Tulasnella sp. 424]KAG8972791.1 RNA exonuclease 3 [Tulasnella sp. 425]
MFATQGLFASTECPERETCRRNPCPFSHKPPKLKSPPLSTPSLAPTSRTVPLTVPETSSSAEASSSNPAKRHANDGSTGSSPPRKLLKAVTKGDGKATAQTKAVVTMKSKPAPTAGPPVLQATPATSKIPLKDRQQMLGQLYTHFTTLYAQILPRKPSLASEHALAQEVEIYNRTNAKTYRNATINVLLAIKKRTPPINLAHPSVGTEGEVNARAAAAKEYPAVQLIPEDLHSALLTPEELVKWGYVTTVLEGWGPGGEEPSETGNEVKCERCDQTFTVRPDPDTNECQYHWGRIWNKKLEGKKKKIYTCCQLEHPHEGCTRGCHVFYETDPATLHKRHAFSPTEGPLEEGKQPLSIVAIDCEMIYTTAGMSVARVSVVNAAGEAVFDELIKSTPGVDVL